MRKLAAAIFVLAVLILPSCRARSPELRLHFIDVGYGDSILIESPNGEFALIDTGPPATREKIIGYLEGQGVDGLEYLIVTHSHADHLGNAAAVLDRFGAEQLRDNGQALDRFDKYLTRELAGEYEREFRGGENYSVLRAGESIFWAGVTLDVLWPPVPEVTKDWNTNSLVLRLRYGDFRALLAGDFNTAGEEILLQDGEADLQAEVLKVGHHGAGDSTGPGFLEAVSCRIAVVSVGENPWGYPDEEALRCLEESGVRLYRTDREGTIVLEAGRDGSVRRRI